MALLIDSPARGPVRPVRRDVRIPSLRTPLENGDRLSVAEFMRRYLASPGLCKAQLIEGSVHMPSPVNATYHAKPDGLIQLWLGTYSIDFPELEVYPNATLILDGDNVVQPDAMLCAPRPGGPVWLDEKDYLHGAPGLVCEVAASSASIDLHAKFQAYQRNGVPEYLVWLVAERKVRWFQLEEGEYVEQKEVAGRLQSRVFPGLILDVRALLKGDKAKLIQGLRQPKA
jgi:Putative restriction endonuclease